MTAEKTHRLGSGGPWASPDSVPARVCNVQRPLRRRRRASVCSRDCYGRRLFPQRYSASAGTTVPQPSIILFFYRTMRSLSQGQQSAVWNTLSQGPAKHHENDRSSGKHCRVKSADPDHPECFQAVCSETVSHQRSHRGVLQHRPIVSEGPFPAAANRAMLLRVRPNRLLTRPRVWRTSGVF